MTLFAAARPGSSPGIRASRTKPDRARSFELASPGTASYAEYGHLPIRPDVSGTVEAPRAPPILRPADLPHMGISAQRSGELVADSVHEAIFTR
jgi:hypothetical protein